MGDIADGNLLIRPTLFKAQTVMWVLFYAYDSALAALIDHALLKPDATEANMRKPSER